MADINFSFAKNYKEAVRAYQMLMNVTPQLKDDEYYYFRDGACLFGLVDYQVHRDVFTSILNEPTNPYHVEALKQMGLVEFYNKNWDKAVEHWMDSLKRERRKD